MSHLPLQDKLSVKHSFSCCREVSCNTDHHCTWGLHWPGFCSVSCAKLKSGAQITWYLDRWKSVSAVEIKNKHTSASRWWYCITEMPWAQPWWYECSVWRSVHTRKGMNEARIWLKILKYRHFYFLSQSFIWFWYSNFWISEHGCFNPPLKLQWVRFTGIYWQNMAEI